MVMETEWAWIPLLLILGYLGKRFVIKNKSGRSSAPGPWRLPIIGNLHQMTMMSWRGLETHQALRELAQKYGPVMRLQLGELSHVVISSAEAAKQVMKTHDVNFASRPFHLAASIIAYNFQNISFSPYGEYWRQMRKVCIVELLSAKRVASFRSIREDEESKMVEQLAKSVEPEGVNMRKMFVTLTSNVTSKAAFGMVHEVNEAFMEIAEKIVYSFTGFRLSDIYPSVKLLPIISGYQSKLVSLHRAMDAILEDIINQHRAARKQTSTSTSQEKTEDIVDILLNLQETGDLSIPLKMEAMKAVILDLFLGGIETTATTTEWTFSRIVSNPTALKLAQEEVRRVFRGKGKVDEDSLHELTYLNACIKETLRMHAPGPLLVPRETGSTVAIDGFEVPAKTRVLVNAWAIGRDSRYWNDPDSFTPERFLDSSIDYKGAHFEFIPFGAGRRICPGMSFGMSLVQVTLANLLFHFDWKPPAGVSKLEDLDMTEHFGIALVRKEILRLVPVPPPPPQNA